LRSVELGVDSNDQLILVDNLPSDSTGDFVRQAFPRWRIIASSENLGFARACNLAVEHTCAEFILLINPDAWVDLSCIGLLRQKLIADGTAALAAPQLRYPDRRLQFGWGPTIGVAGETLQRIRNAFEGQYWAQAWLPRVLRLCGDSGWYTAAIVLIRRQAWVEVSGFDPGYFLYFEDADLCIRLRRAGWRLADVADANAFHVKQGPYASPDRLIHYREGQLRYYRKFRPAWENHVLLGRVMSQAERVQQSELRLSLLAVCERARKALELGVVDLPGGPARFLSSAAVRGPDH
jgi:N-acetylglucosaminyl-diphospho-decaprenol L-rhamnosyltransferase